MNSTRGEMRELVITQLCGEGALRLRHILTTARGPLADCLREVTHGELAEL